ncbi:MAG: DedA family protein [Candidatus Lustribacter sp.]|jgi:membrane protein DedA with SNARE-associated domain
MEHLSAYFHDLVVHFGYAGLFVVTVLGNVGFPAAIELVMLSGGALAATGHLPGLGPVPGWVVVGAVGLLGELCGGSLLYAVGYYGGLPFVHRYGKYVRFREHELERVHAFYEKHGRTTVFWCRFIPFVRGLSALPPGLSRMPKRYFLTYTALGSGIFCFVLAALGDEAGRNVDAITAYIHAFALAIGAGAVAVIVIAIVVWRIRRARRAAVAPRPGGSSS